MDSIRKICVCSVKMPFLWGGAEIFSKNLILQLRKRSYEVDTVSLPLQVQPTEEVVKSCLAWRMVNLDKTLDGEKIDLVVGTKFPSYMVPHPNKVIWLLHQHRDIYDLYGTVYSGVQNNPKEIELRHKIIDLDQLAFGEARKILSISSRVAARLKQHNGFDSAVVYPPLQDAGRFHYDSMGDFVLSVSRLAGNKRIHLLIEALQHVSPSIHAIIVGEGVLENEYKQLAEKKGVSNRVIFTGSLSRMDVIELYARAGVVFHCPVDEDYGYVTLEAFYSGKPVLCCTDSGAVLEFVDSSTGWVTEPDPKAIAACIEEAQTNKSEAETRGKEGRRKISFITWDYVFDHLLG